MKKIISAFCCLAIVFTTFCFSGCSSKAFPNCIGFVLNNIEVFFEDDNIDTISLASISNISYKSEDLKDYDHVVNTGETFELSFILNNPQNDTILNITLDDSIDGKNKVYSSQSEKYNIKDITTEYIEEKDTYYTYVTLVITSCDIETERLIKIKEIDFVRNKKDKKSKCDDNSIREVKIFTKIQTQNLTLTTNKSSLKLNELAELSIVKSPENASMEDIIYSVTNNKQSLQIVGNTVKCVNDSISEPVTIKATLDGVDSNEITIYPNTPIDSFEQLNSIRNYSSGYFYLTADIDFLNQSWEPITAFTGVLNGCNYTLKNLTIQQNNAVAALLNENYGTIRNLNFSNANVTGYNVGVVCSKNYGFITKCSIIGTVNVVGPAGQTWSHAGLVCAYNYNSIEQCSTSGFVNGNGQSILGGIAAYNMRNGNILPVIKNCFTNVSCNSGLYNGGIVGSNVYSGTIQNCLSITSSNITGASSSQINNCKIENCLVVGSDAVVCHDVQPAYIVNSYAYSIAQENLNNKEYYINTLKFSEQVWNFDNINYSQGKYPILLI